MKKDLDSLMQARGIDALLITGPAQHNPAMLYLSGGGHLTSADLIKIRGSGPVLFHRAMERDEAARTGLETRSLDDTPLENLLRAAGGDFVRAIALRYQQMLAGLGITAGRIAVYGRVEVGGALAVFSELQRLAPGLEIVGEFQDALLMEAMATKDEAEIERIRRMGRMTVEIAGETAGFLTSHQARGGVLVKADGLPLTVGEVKSRINLWLVERGGENPEGTIFAIGRDAGVPHSTGRADDRLRQGQTIVFDFFPCEMGGGYYHDFTRTWCLGYATDEALALYEDVLAVYHQIRSELLPGRPFRDYQKRACDLFEARGHPTLQSNPRTLEGYVHGLGHGVGLRVQERPHSGEKASGADRLDPGVVVTVEPGLYYPERGLGVRLEDTLVVCPDGSFEVLAEYPIDLVLPMKVS